MVEVKPVKAFMLTTEYMFIAGVTIHGIYLDKTVAEREAERIKGGASITEIELNTTWHQPMTFSE